MKTEAGGWPVSIAVFDQDGGEVTAGRRAELVEGLSDLVPLDDGLADDDAAEVERAVARRRRGMCPRRVRLT